MKDTEREPKRDRDLTRKTLNERKSPKGMNINHPCATSAPGTGLRCPRQNVSRAQRRCGKKEHPAKGALIIECYRTLLKKAFVTSCCGFCNSSAGVPCSIMAPSCMNRILSLTSRAKPISWVTTTIVMPSATN